MFIHLTCKDWFLSTALDGEYVAKYFLATSKECCFQWVSYLARYNTKANRYA